MAILARIARDEEQGVDIRIRAATTLLDYSRPKVKAIEHDVAKKRDEGRPMVIGPPKPLEITFTRVPPPKPVYSGVVVRMHRDDDAAPMDEAAS